MAQLSRQGAAAPPRQVRPAPRVENLKVVVLDKAKGGRFVLR